MLTNRKWLIVSATLIVALSAYLAVSWVGGTSDEFGAGGMMCYSGKCCKVCPEDFAKAGNGDVEGRPVLNPLMFIGTVREAYIVAQQNPWLLAQLWCYCGCDKTNGHKSLLDCYRDYHGATCAICAGEALEANQLFNQGSPVDQIRDALRARFARRG